MTRKIIYALLCVVTLDLCSCSAEKLPQSGGENVSGGGTDNPAEVTPALTSDYHPRLFLNDEQFGQMKQKVLSGADPQLTALHEAIMYNVEAIGMVSSVLKYEKKDASAGSSALANTVHRTALERIYLSSYAWRFTGEQKYFDQALKTIKEVCSFPDWNTKGSSLDMAELATAVAIGYDWLYKDLSSEVKALAEKAMLDFALTPSDKGEYSQNFYNNNHNWNQVCNAGLVCAALATYEKYPEFAKKMIDKSVTTNRRAVEVMYAPDGIYPEGPSYWSYGTAFQCVMLSALESCLGTDYGISAVNGFNKTGHFMLFAVGATEKFFNFSDTMETLVPIFPMWYFADKFQQPSLLYNELRYLQSGKYKKEADETRLLPLVMTYAYKIDLTNVTKPSDTMYSGGGENPLVMFHTDWTYESSDMYLGIKAGRENFNHGHMDAGSFVFDAENVRWAMDLPRQSYDDLRAVLDGELFYMAQESQRWNVFRINNKQHNTLTINDAYHKVTGRATVLSATNGARVKTAKIDLTQILGGEAAGVTRTFRLEGKDLIILDEIEAKSDKDANVRWTLVSYATPEVLSDGKAIKLSVGQTIRYLVAESDNDAVAVKYEIFEKDPKKLTDFPALRAKEKYYNNTHVLGYTATVPKGTKVTLKTKLTRILL